MPRETEVGILVEGKEVKVRLRCLKEREVRELRKKAGLAFSPASGKVEGDYIGFIEMCVERALCMDNPFDPLNLDSPEFEKLKRAYMNLITPTEDEKGFLPRP